MSYKKGEKPLKEDFMLKRPILKKWYSRGNNLKYRWFILSNHRLRYCDGTLETGIQTVKGEIQLKSIMIIENTDSEGLSLTNAFQVVYSDNGQTYYLYIIANYVEQRNSWVEALRNASRKEGAIFTRNYHPGAWLCKTGQFSCCSQLVRNSSGCKPIFNRSVSNMSNGREEPANLKSYSQDVSPKEDVVPSLVAVFSYQKQGSGINDMSVYQGEKVNLLEKSDEHWWMVENESGHKGYVPANRLRPISSHGMEQYGWFSPDISKGDADNLLSEDGRIGCFLIRKSVSSENYTLSVLGINSNIKFIKHLHILKDDNGLHYFSEKHKFHDLNELVTYYKTEKGGVGIKLSHPPIGLMKKEDLPTYEN